MVLENCTIVTNLGEGINRSGGTLAATNCILWANGMDATGTMALASSDVGVWASAVTRTNCISVDPQFVNATTNNYRLLLTSPCINQGTNEPNWMTGATDLAGAPRIQNKRVDMGAYETLLPSAGTAVLFR